MQIQPFTIDNEIEAKDFLTDLLKKPEYQSMSVIEERAFKLVKDPNVRAYFLAEGESILAELKGRAWNEKPSRPEPGDWRLSR